MNPQITKNKCCFSLTEFVSTSFQNEKRDKLFCPFQTNLTDDEVRTSIKKHSEKI